MASLETGRSLIRWIRMVLVRGWDSTTPPPATRQEKSQVKLVLVESTSSHDHHLVDAESHKRSKYVQLVLALQSEGWVVELSGDVKPAQWDGVLVSSIQTG